MNRPNSPLPRPLASGTLPQQPPPSIEQGGQPVKGGDPPLPQPGQGASHTDHRACEERDQSPSPPCWSKPLCGKLWEIAWALHRTNILPSRSPRVLRNWLKRQVSLRGERGENPDLHAAPKKVERPRNPVPVQQDNSDTA